MVIYFNRNKKKTETIRDQQQNPYYGSIGVFFFFALANDYKQQSLISCWVQCSEFRIPNFLYAFKNSKTSHKLRKKQTHTHTLAHINKNKWNTDNDISWKRSMSIALLPSPSSSSSLCYRHNLHGQWIWMGRFAFIVTSCKIIAN